MCSEQAKLYIMSKLLALLSGCLQNLHWPITALLFFALGAVAALASVVGICMVLEQSLVEV